MIDEFIQRPEFNNYHLELAIKEEFYSPHVLQYKRQIVNFFIEKINEKENYLKNELDPKHQIFAADIITFELDRLKYILKKYLRMRLCKIEKNIFYIFQNDLAAYLSKSEFNFALNYYNILCRQFDINFLNKVDERYGNKLFYSNIHENSKNLLNVSIVDPPNDNKFVFVRFNENISNMVFDKGNTLKFQKGDILLAAYKYLKTFIEEGKVILI